METLRELIAALIFIIGSALIFSIIGDLHWERFLGGVTCFVIAYFTWPSRKRGHRKQGHSFLDVLEFVIELPIEIFIWVFRLLGRMFRNKDGGFDVDIDL